METTAPQPTPLELAGKFASIILGRLSDTIITGTEIPLSIKDGVVRVDVSESPVFVVVNK